VTGAMTMATEHHHLHLTRRTLLAWAHYTTTSIALNKTTAVLRDAVRKRRAVRAVRVWAGVTRRQREERERAAVHREERRSRALRVLWLHWQGRVHVFEAQGLAVARFHAHQTQRVALRSIAQLVSARQTGRREMLRRSFMQLRAVVGRRRQSIKVRRPY
jgi:hypothetical protein